MKLIHIKWTEKPPQTEQVYKPQFRSMTDEEIIKEIERTHKNYTKLLYSKNLATVFIKS